MTAPLQTRESNSLARYHFCALKTNYWSLSVTLGSGECIKWINGLYAWGVTIGIESIWYQWMWYGINSSLLALALKIKGKR